MTKMAMGITTAVPAITIGLGTGGGAIMTTDRAPNLHGTGEIGGKTVHCAGIAQGSGMIHPNLATMLCFIINGCEYFSTHAQEGPVSVHEDSLMNLSGWRHEYKRYDPLHGQRSRGQQRPGAEKARRPKFPGMSHAVARSLAKQVVKDGEGRRSLWRSRSEMRRVRWRQSERLMAVAKSSLVRRRSLAKTRIGAGSWRPG